MHGFLMFIHIVVSFLLVIIVLLQSGKSADLAGAFGGMGSQSTFGPRGAASFLSKMTTTLAVLFMITSLLLYIISANRSAGKSVMGKEPVKQEQKMDKNKETGGAKTETQESKDNQKQSEDVNQKDANKEQGQAGNQNKQNEEKVPWY